jgi:hypothetical protein
MGKVRPLRRSAAALIFCCAVVAIVALPGTAAALGVATTGEATALTPTSATLNGIVAADGGGATWFFEYGTTTAYGHVTPTSSVNGGSHPVSAKVAGLAPGTTYHFRLVAQDNYQSSGEPPGADVTFTTPVAPSTIATTGQATSVTATSAELNGVVNAGSAGATWLFEYGKTTSYDHSTKETAVGTGLTVVSSKVTGLAPDTTHHFRLVVRQPPPAPTLSTGRDSTFTTARAFGKVTLRRHHLVVRHGRAAIPFNCSGASGAACQGKLTLNTRTKTGEHTRSTGCGKASLSATAVAKPTVRVKLGRRCSALLADARKHQLGARLRVVFAGGQRPLSTGVRLIRR